MLGIAAKAGGVASGEFSTEKAVKDGRAWLVIVASDASENTQKHFRDMTTFYEVPMYVYGEKETLGHFIGKEFRASLAVTNEGVNIHENILLFPPHNYVSYVSAVCR